MTEIDLDIRTIAPPDRRPTIFATFDHLPLGDSFVLANDHDPIPLFLQFEAERRGTFNWAYLVKGPDSVADTDHPHRRGRPQRGHLLRHLRRLI